jgi:hypothetical protein
MANTGNGSIASSQYAKTHYARGRLKQTVSKKEKKMGFFRKKFNKWVRDAWNEAQNTTEVAIRNHESVSAKSSVRFTIYPASGGYVIEHYKQDRYKESDGPELTIVNNSDTIGTTVEHILTMEALKS